MNQETQIQAIAGYTETLLESYPDTFLVEIKITLGNQIKLFVDGESGITIERCVAISRALYKQLEETGMFPDGNFALEVSSPGLDEPLKIHRQYTKNVGRKVEVLLVNGTLIEGKLVAVEDDTIQVEEKKGKKKEIINHTVSFQDIKTTKIQVVF